MYKIVKVTGVYKEECEAKETGARLVKEGYISESYITAVHMQYMEDDKLVEGTAYQLSCITRLTMGREVMHQIEKGAELNSCMLVPIEESGYSYNKRVMTHTKERF